MQKCINFFDCAIEENFNILNFVICLSLSNWKELPWMQYEIDDIEEEELKKAQVCSYLNSHVCVLSSILLCIYVL